MDDFNCTEIIKNILGDKLYEDLITKISKEIVEKRKLDIELTDFYDNVVKDYCFIILMIGMSKKAEVDIWNIKLDNMSWKLKSNDFTKQYNEFIRVVEDKKFNKINKML